MTPTDAARTIQEQCYGTCYEACNQLEAAQARIAALEGALRQIRELTEDGQEHNQQLSEVWYIADSALTPEGELNGN